MFKKKLIFVTNSALLPLFIYLHRTNTYLRPK